MKEKAYGFPLTHCRHEFGELVYGEVWSESGQKLGSWTSSGLRWLKVDLEKHADGYDFHFLDKAPDNFRNLVGESNAR